MAWTTPRCWVTGEVVTAALLNAQIKSNMDLTAPAKLTSAGDMLYSTGANATARLAKGSNGNILHQASCAPAWTASPSFTGLTLSGALDVNGTIDYDGTDVDVLSSGDIDLVSSANAAAAIYIAQSTGTSGTIKIHADTGTSVTEGAESVNILSDVGGVGIRSTANLAKAINITSDGGSTGSISIFNDQGTSVTEGAESISLLSDAGGIGIRSTANLANAVNITSDGGSTATIQIYNDQGTSVTEGAASISLVSDAGGVELRSTANLVNAINITSDGGTTGTISIFNDLGSSVTEGAESISLLSDAGGVGIRSTANLANAVNITADGGTTSTIQIFNDQGTAVNEGVASIQILSDVGGIGIKSGLNAAGAIRLTADAGTSETIILHADQGNGVGSICLSSDVGGITLNPATFVTIGGNATNAGEIRIMEDSDAGTNYVAVKAQNMSASYTLTLPADDGCCGETLTTNGSGTLTWAAAGGQTINNATANELVTIGATTTELCAEANLTFDGSTLVVAGDINVTGTPEVYIGGATTNAKMTIGLTIDQDANGNEILALKSSDITHGVTGEAETDTYASFGKEQEANGGLRIVTFSDSGARAFYVRAIAACETATRSGSANAPLQFAAARPCPSCVCTYTGLQANQNLMVIGNGAPSTGFAKFIFDSDGDSHEDGTGWTNYDDYCDPALVRSVGKHLTPEDDPIQANFNDFMAYNRCQLEAAKLVTFNDDGHHFINTSRLAMLHNGAIWQLSERIKVVETQLTQLALQEGK